MAPPILLLIAGPSNAGKTTTAKQLRSRQFLRFSSDRYCKQLFIHENRWLDGPVQGVRTACARALEDAIAAWHSGANVALEGIPFMRPGEIRRFLSAAADARAAPCYVLLEPPPCIRRQRLHRRIGPGRSIGTWFGRYAIHGWSSINLARQRGNILRLLDKSRCRTLWFRIASWPPSTVAQYVYEFARSASQACYHSTARSLYLQHGRKSMNPGKEKP